MAVESHAANISHVIQLAVAPVFLLTAIATIINAENMRLGRIVDRQRVLLDKLAGLGEAETAAVHDELRNLGRRIKFIYFSILCAVVSALLVCLVVAGAFIGAMFDLELAQGVVALFVAAMVALVASLSLFLREVFFAVRVAMQRMN